MISENGDEPKEVQVDDAGSPEEGNFLNAASHSGMLYQEHAGFGNCLER